MSLTVVITPFTVTVATAVLEEVQLKFPLPPVACEEHQRIRVINLKQMEPLTFDLTLSLFDAHKIKVTFGTTNNAKCL